MTWIDKKNLYQWCKIPYSELENSELRIPFRLCVDSAEMGRMMARELVDEIREHNQAGKVTRAIIPCGPSCWYGPFTDLVNCEKVSLRNLIVFHMDECLDWQGNELPLRHPYSFRGFMEKAFYGPIPEDLNVLPENRVWLNSRNIKAVSERIGEAPVDIAFGGWGQDGHVAYNQARRNLFSHLSVDDLRLSSIRVQENNPDTILALAQRTFGAAYQFVPPMSVTLGMKEILAAKKIRLFSDTGAWKQTALRVALFSPITVEYPITLLQEHPDTILTATIETASHPIADHPEWDLGFQEA
jgi:glucosamine-6-phosphate deaminase